MDTSISQQDNWDSWGFANQKDKGWKGKQRKSKPDLKQGKKKQNKLGINYVLWTANEAVGLQSQVAANFSI